MKRKPKKVSVFNLKSLRTLLENTPTMQHFEVIEQGEDTSYVFVTTENMYGFRFYTQYEYDYMPTELNEDHLVRESKTKLKEEIDID